MKKALLLAFSLMLPFAAVAEAGAPQGAGISQLLILGVFVFFLFFMMRSQSKRSKDHQKMVGGLEKGDEVITSGGLLGKITKVSDTFLAIQLSEGIEVFVQKSMIANSVPKGTMRSI